MNLKYTKFQIALEIIGLLILVGMIVFVYIWWNQIPQQIPLHYNAMGEIDSWGSKDAVLFLPVVSILLYVLITAVSFFPQFLNVPVKITDENRGAVYINMRNLVISIKVEILALFVSSIYYIATAQPLPAVLSPVFMVIIFSTLIFFVVRITRL